MKKLLTILFFSCSFLFLKAIDISDFPWYWQNHLAPTFVADSMYIEGPVSIGSLSSYTDSVVITTDTVFVYTSEGIFKLIKTPGSANIDTIGIVIDVDLTGGKTDSISTGQSASVPKIISIQDTSFNELVDDVFIEGYDTIGGVWYIMIYSTTAYDSLIIYYIKDDAGIDSESGLGGSISKGQVAIGSGTNTLEGKDSLKFINGGLELTGRLKASTNRYKFYSDFDSNNVVLTSTVLNDTGLVIYDDLLGDGSSLTKKYELTRDGVHYETDGYFIYGGTGDVTFGAYTGNGYTMIKSIDGSKYIKLDDDNGVIVNNGMFINDDTIADVGKENFLKLGTTAGEGFDAHLNGNTDLLLSAESMVRISGGGNLSYGISTSDTTIEAHGGTTIYVNDNFTTSGINRLGDAQSDTVVIPGWLKYIPPHTDIGFKDSTATITGGDSVQVTNAGDSLFRYEELYGFTYGGGDTIITDFKGGWDVNVSVAGSVDNSSVWKLELAYKRSGITYYDDLRAIDMEATGAITAVDGSEQFYFHSEPGDKVWLILTRISGTGDFEMHKCSWNFIGYIIP